MCDLTFENVQAGERTSHLFRLANYHQALVVGTGDLSELALGWCTYGVGDQMSHYNVNASVPKTLIGYLIGWVMTSNQFNRESNAILDAILKTKISPELVPGDDEAADEPSQLTETAIGPFELLDFNLYYISRFGHSPSKVAFLAHHAWGDRARGTWPETVRDQEKREYSLSEIKRWLEVFVHRFFQVSQFKRSCLPNGPKVGSGDRSHRGAIGAHRAMPEADAWLRELREGIPDA